MDDEHVLAMPARRFWWMEAQISRLEAHESMTLYRTIRGAQAQEEGAKEFLEHTQKNIGEVAKVRRSAVVKAEPDAKQKMLSMMG